MTGARLAVTEGAEDALLSLEVNGAEVLRPSPLVRLEVDRRRRDRLVDPVIDASDDGSFTVRARVEGTDLDLLWRASRLAGLDVWELAFELTNEGDQDVNLTRLDPIAAGLGGAGWDALAFRSAWGDEFRPETHRADVDLFFESRAGRSSHGYIPWVGFEREGAGLIVSPAWSGNWHVDVAEGGIVTAGISDWQFETVLRPGEKIVAPSVVVAAGSDRDDAAVALTTAVGAVWTPRSSASDRLDVEWNHWWPYEDAEVDEQVIAANADLAVQAGIRQVTVDAGWFGPSEADSFWSRVRGDWSRVNAVRFPSGMAALGDRIRSAGARPGIWMEAEAVGSDACLRIERPGVLALAVDGRRPDRSYRVGSESLDPQDPTFLGYVCCGSEEGRRFVAESLDAIVDEMGAEWLKLDFNVDPDAGCTRTDHGHGAGDGLFRHYEGLYAVLDAFRAKHPELVLEACASGGLRLDLGLAKHVHCMFLSDPDYTEHALQVFWGASMMLPPASILHWSWSQWRGDYPPAQLDFDGLSGDEFATTLRAALLHRFGVSLRLPELRDDLMETLAEHVGFYTSTVAALVRDGIVRRLTGQPERGGRGERLPAFQLSSSDGRTHVVTAFRLAERDHDAIPGGRVLPVALDADAEYRVTDPFDGADPEVIAGPELLSRGFAAPVSEGRMASSVRVIERV